MLRARAQHPETGRVTVFFGLSEGNLRLLREGKPIEFPGESLGDPGRDYVLCYGATEHDLLEVFLPLTDPRTDVRIDPRVL